MRTVNEGLRVNDNRCTRARRSPRSRGVAAQEQEWGEGSEEESTEGSEEGDEDEG
jgi:hypothetical protein